VRDPRAEHLFTLLPPNDAVDALAAAARRRHLPFRNVDLALASMGETFGMIPDAGELVRAVARTAGWLAHAVEEYERPHRYPTRITYVGR
ncbi:MAG TPA: citrate/2-methylcitrate synthase, partial [Acidimicrobiales bacterium]|nr:citrate/2-methylcitrate synthase [Acidimicrobiales bacterium]